MSSDSKQTTDAANAANKKAAGTGCGISGLYDTSAGAFSGTVGGKPSGESQGSNRGLREHTRGAGEGSN